MKKERTSLLKLLNEICDEKTFIHFLDALKNDRVQLNHEWKNGTIEAYLECAHAWAEASVNGLTTYSKPENAWKRCADILYMGKYFE